VLIEGVICLFYLIVSQGVLTSLQQVSALGCVLSYTLSVTALLKAIKNNPLAKDFPFALPLLGLASCSILLLACVKSFFSSGMESLLLYTLLLGAGAVMFMYTSKKMVTCR